ncbi:hypothetical protein MTR67_040150 [Solanum verrucosum]|uniref:Reverse transcriptase zinc-binding domain-containing protein n=1 Tax=Solanum verrucosum TaxID=315347 RepID=A0AAF0UI40_SOLVR|nr:hypothetical protein MTR67_040150 [Solanum verrucosum]
MKAHFKVVCFSWLVTRNVCLTQDKLQIRGFQLCSRCFLCRAVGEKIVTYSFILRLLDNYGNYS